MGSAFMSYRCAKSAGDRDTFPLRSYVKCSWEIWHTITVLQQLQALLQIKRTGATTNITDFKTFCLY